MAKPIYKIEIANADGTVWKTVTTYARSVSVTRGRSRELDKFEAGSFNITFNNFDRTFDPQYTSSSLYGYIVPNRKVLIYASNSSSTYYVVFAGFITDWNLTYDISGESYATASGTDAFSFLAQQTLTGGLQNSELSGTRVDTVLADSNITWPVGVTSVVYPGTKTLMADTIDAGANALEYLQSVEQTEQGFLFVNKLGDIEFRGANDSSLTAFNFTDAGTVGNQYIPYTGIDIQYGTENLYNQITLTNVDSSFATYENTTSIATYGRIVFENQNLLYRSTTDTDSAARVLAIKYGDPEYRIDSITVHVNSMASTKQDNVVPLELTDIVKVTFTPNGVGSAVNQYVRIVGIDHQMDVDQHIMILHFQSVSKEQFILDDTIFGVLDSNVLGF